MLAKIKFFVNTHRQKLIHFSITLLLIALAFTLGFIIGARVLELPQIILR